jgi:hypothetical protein
MYKNYALIKDGLVLQYPVDPRKYDPATNTFNIHEYWEGGDLDGNTYVFCHTLEPKYNYDERLVEKTPALNVENGKWYCQYDIVKVDADTLAERRKLFQQGVDEVFAFRIAEFEAMASVISELSENQQIAWKAYHQALLDMHLHPHYPFRYKILERPDQDQNLKIEVIRI